MARCTVTGLAPRSAAIRRVDGSRAPAPRSGIRARRCAATLSGLLSSVMASEDSAIHHRAHPLLSRPVYSLLLAGAFLIYASANAPVPIATELRAGLGLAGSSAAIFLLPFAVGFGAGSFLWFAAARNRASRALLPLSLVLMAVASLPLLFTGSPSVAVIGRALVGVAAAGYPAVAQAVISRSVPSHARGRMIGGFVMAVVAGSFIGQAVVGGVADAISTEAALGLVCVLAPVATAIALWRALPTPTDDGGGARGGAMADVPGLIARQWPVLTVAFLSFGGYWLLLSQLPVAVRDERFDLSAGEAGALPAIGLLGLVSAAATGRASDRFGQRLPMVTTLAIGLAGLAVTLPTAAPLWAFALGYGVFLAAYWGYLPAASAEVVARSAEGERQPALMAFYAAMWTGAAVAPAAGAVLDNWNQAAVVALAAWSAALAVAAITFTTVSQGILLSPRREGAP